MTFSLTNKTNKIIKKAFSAILCAFFLFQQVMILPVLADTPIPTNITNITGIANNAPSGSNIYNITPTSFKGSTGFRSYTDFNLGAGDVANLIYGSSYSKFVNLVQNQININGLLNTMKDSNFYNGHAVFVSPNGMVVGSSGVLNVGALSVFTPKQTTFDSFSANLNEDLTALKTDNQGLVTINGKIFARDGVDIYGKTITVGDGTTSNTSTGIFAGLSASTYNTGINTDKAGADLFGTLVNTDGITQGTAFTNVNGKIVIKAQATTTDGSNAISSVTVKNALLYGNGIDASATSSATYKPNADTIKSIDTSNLDDVISNNYSSFTGPVSSATVDISTGAKLVSTDNVNFSTSAVSQADISCSKLTKDDILYSLGTDTTSKVDVEKGASISTSKDLTASAVSQNSLKVSLTSKNSTTDDNDSSVRVIVLNTKTNANTTASLNQGSSIKAKDVAVNAVNVISNDIAATTTAKFNQKESDGSQASPSVGGTVVLNNSNITTNATIDTKIDTSNAGNVNINAQTYNNNLIQATSTATGNTSSGQADPATTQKTGDNAGTLDKIKGIYSKVTAKSKSGNTTQTDVSGSGSLIVNNSNLTTTAKVGKNATINADNVSINANTVDLTMNQANAKSTTAKFAAGGAVIANFQNDTTTASIEDGTSSAAADHASVTANSKLTVNATTEMPWNLTTLQFLYGAYNTAIDPFSSAFWDSFITNAKNLGTQASDVYSTFKEAGGTSSYGIAGFFNNFAQSKGGGDTTGVAGSVIYSQIVNSTTARIGNYSTITQGSTGSVVVNAANDIISTNLAGDAATINKLSSTNTSDTSSGIGGALLISDNTHNATAQIGDNVVVNAGATSVNAATSQTQINIAAGGSKGTGVGVQGSVAVIIDGGNTEASVGNSQINANSLFLNAGSASIYDAGRKDLAISGLDTTTNLLTLDSSATAVSDKTSLVTIAGAIAQQSGDGNKSGASSSSGVAVGASIAVVDVEKSINATIADGANITLDKGLDVDASTTTQGINIAVAGAFAGGVSTKKTKQDATNEDSSSSSNQQMSNQGGWLDKINNVLDKVTGKTTDADAATTAATGSDVKNNNKNSGADKTTTDAAGKTTTPDKTTNLEDKTTGSDSLAKTANSSTATSNLSLAAAGAVNAQIYSSDVNAGVGKATIKTNNGDVNIKATQNNLKIDVATGIANSKTVGAGAAVNVELNSGTTTAQSDADITLNNAKNLNIQSNADQKGIDIAIGVGAAKNSENNKSSVNAAVGGSFNVSVDTSVANASLGGDSQVKNAKDVNVTADNTTQLYKVAGGVAYASGGDTNIGAGIAANVSVLNKSTDAFIASGASITDSTGNTVVSANGDLTSDTPAERLVSAAVGGAIVTGGESSYTFAGAIGADIIANTTTATVTGANINSNVLNVLANDYIWNLNMDGAITFSNKGGVGVGLGTAVEVVSNTVSAYVDASTVVANSGEVNVKANEDETLRFLAINMGLTASESSGLTLGVNGIVNVLDSSVTSYINNSSITQIDSNTSNVNVGATYNALIQGITAAATASGSNAVGGNIIANVLKNNVDSHVSASDLTSQGILSVNAVSNENINTIPVAIAVSTGGTIAAAADISANVILNKTNANISGSKTVGGKISAKNGVNVSATDNTSIVSRGGTLAAAINGSSIGGSALIDILVKNTNASIGDNTTVLASNGKISVNAGAENDFGVTKDPVTGKVVPINLLSCDTTTIKSLTTLGDWEMAYDVAGGSEAAVSGSLITKVINNTVSSSIGKNSSVTGSSVDVLANNSTYVRAIVGQLAVSSGDVGIGASIFANIVSGSTSASIGSGSTVESKKDDINVGATSTEDVKTIMVMGSGSSSVAINGSLNANVFTNQTTATINGATNVTSAGKLNVKASQINDLQTFNLAIAGSGDVSVGAVAYSNTYVNTTTADIIGSTVKSNGNILVNSTEADSFGGIIGDVSVSGTTGIAGLVIANVLNSNINSYISNSTVTSDTDSINVDAAYDFNKTKYGDKDISAYLTGLKNGGKYSSSDLISNYVPIVTALNVTGSGNASIGLTFISNIVNSTTKAYVDAGSTISSAKGLGISANSDIIAYDAMASFAVAGEGAAVPISAITNVILNKTSAYLDKSTVTNGNVDVEATQNTSINSVLAGVSFVGIGGAVSPILSTNVLGSTTSARITDSNINNSTSVIVKSNSIETVNTLSLVGAGAAIGGAVTGDVNSNILLGTTEAYIAGTNSDGVLISNGSVDVEANNTLTAFDLISAASVSGVGANVGVNVGTNVIVNNVNSYIKNAKLANNTMAKTVSNSTINLYDIVAACGFSGVGASISGTVITNVIDNDVNSYIASSKITGGTVATTATQTTNLNGGVVAINAGGLAVAASVQGVTNVFEDRVNSYISDSTLTGNTGTTVSGSSTENINFATLSASAAGLGGVSGSVITNVIGNTLHSYISGGSIDSSGAIAVTATQSIDMNNLSGGVQLGAEAAGANVIVNVLTNNAEADIDGTAITNSSSINVNATSTENMVNNNYSFNGAVDTAIGVAVLTNVIENTTQSYIDANSNTVKTSGALNVASSDNLTLDNKAGVVAITGNTAASGSININIINNNVTANLLSSNTGLISANTVDVNSTSTMNLGISTASAAGGSVGLAGTLAVTSIGDRVNTNDSDTKAYISGATNKAQTGSSAPSSSLTATANGTTYGDKNTGTTSALNAGTGTALSATGSSANQGTVANINANVTSTGAINVKASNTLKGLNSDTATINNAAVAGGLVAAGASVLVTDMKYKTTAEITGGTVKSNSNINVQTTNTAKASTNALSGVAGAVAIGGNVALFKNQASTTALIKDSSVSTPGDVSVLADSTDIISAKAISGAVGLGTANVVVALSKTTNNTTAQVDNSTINGGTSSTKADDVNVKASNTSTLASEMESASVSGIGITALVNLAQSNSITSAIINDSSNIYSNNLNLISSTGGISAETTMYVGSLTYYGASIEAAGADVNSTFNSAINGTIKTDNDVNIKAGVNKTNEIDKGLITADVLSKSVNVSVVSASDTTQIANARANTNITIDSGSTITAGDAINIYSALNRTATTGNSSANLGGISLKALVLDAEANGSSNINIGGSLIADTINSTINDNNTANVKMLSGTLSLVSGSLVVSEANVGSVANTTLASTGSLNADTITINSNSTRTSGLKNASYGASLLSLGATTMKATTSGSSTIDLEGKTTANYTPTSALNVNINDSSTSSNDSLNYSLSLASANVLTLNSIVNTGSSITLGGNIDAVIINANNNITRNTIANSASSSVGLANLSYIDLESIINGNSSINVTGNVLDNTTLSLNSVVKNTVETYLSTNSAGLVALAKGTTENHINNTTNYINFVNANVSTNGSLSATAATTNTVYMTANSGTYGFIAVKGGKLTNDIASTTGAKFSGSNAINAKDITISSSNTTNSPNTIKFDDSSGGFIDSSGAKINTTINQINDVKAIDNTNVYGTKSLTINMDNNTNFSQEVDSSAHGFSCYNTATSNLNVTNNNKLTINEYVTNYIQGGTVNINENVNNTLSSVSKVDAEHFAGQPSTNSRITLNNYNNIDVYSNLQADKLMNINLMTNSYNNLYQYAYVYAEAAIASADWAGGINYNVNNGINVHPTGKIASAQDVDITYSNGSEILNSTVKYDKCSRLLFGIKIHSKGSSSRISASRTNTLQLDGTIAAGSNAHTTLKINQDGTVDTSNSTMSTGTYTKKDTTSSADTTIGTEETDNLTTALKTLQDEKTSLEQDKTANTAKLAEIDAQIKVLNDDINSYNSEIASINYAAGLNSSDVVRLSDLKSQLITILQTAIGTDTYNHLSDDVKAKLIDNISTTDLSNTTTIATTLSTAINSIDSIANVTLSADAKIALNSSLSAYYNKFSETTAVDKTGAAVNVQKYTVVTTDSKNQSVSTTYTVYDDITLVSTLNSQIADNNLQITNLNGNKNSFDNSSINSQLSTINSQIANYQAQINALSNNSSLLTSANGSYVFNDINLSGGSINIKGINPSNITGSGKFVLDLADLEINNYSKYNLIFNNITIGNNSSGLMINGVHYPKRNSIFGLGSSSIISDIKLVVEGSTTGNAGQITINNWFDASDPTLADNTIPSTMLFKGAITNKIGGINIFNDGGNIIFANGINASNINIAAPQGSINYKATGTALTLDSGDSIIAGKDVTITAGTITNNGLISAGNSNKNIIITNDTLNNATGTETVNGVTYKVINIKGTSKSAYLNSSDNVKALYNSSTNEILLFDTTASGGSVILTGAVSGIGTVTYSTGYGTINIDNQTTAKLVVDNINNNYYNGTAFGLSDRLSLANKGVKSANTTINSTGAIKIAKALSSGNNGIDTTGIGQLTINSKSDLTVANPATIDTTGTANITSNGDLTVNGSINNRNGSTTFANNGTGSSKVAVLGTISNTNGNLNINNAGSNGINISGSTTNTTGNTTIANNGQGGVSISGTITNNSGNTLISNAVNAGIVLSGSVINTLGSTAITNNGSGGIFVSGSVNNSAGINNTDINITNNVDSGINVTSTGTINNTGTGNTLITNNGTDGINVAQGGKINNSTGNLTLTNTGVGNIDIAGSLSNISGLLSLLNTNTEASGIIVESTGIVQNTNGILTIDNYGYDNGITSRDSSGEDAITIAGLVKNKNGNMLITNEYAGGNISIGDTSAINARNNNLTETNGNVFIVNHNGSLLNAGVDNTLVSVTNGNLIMKTTNGDIGAYDPVLDATTTLSNKYGIEAATRNYKETFNINVTGTVTASALNSVESPLAEKPMLKSFIVSNSKNSTTDRLINLRSVKSNMNVNTINADGNVMLTAADWKQPDQLNPNPINEAYFTGYSILNANTSGTANITGKNISLLSSNNIGTANNWFTYNQTSNTNCWLSAEAENDLYLKGLSDNYDTNIWEAITKRGNLGLELPGNTTIREITAGNNLTLINRGTNLTIYDLGKATHMLNPNDDLLYPHDKIKMSDVTPASLNLEVLDINSRTRINPLLANSILNIYNAYVRGLNLSETEQGVTTRVPDVTLRADNIIANAYGAVSSNISTLANPSGYNAYTNRNYTDNPFDASTTTLYAKGFNTVGSGESLAFDIRGVNPELVSAIGQNVNSRNYYLQPIITTIEAFTNKFYKPGIDYKMNNITLSVDDYATQNRGSVFNYLYANNAYIDTLDINIALKDAIINNYAEFRNGNGGMGTGYRWSTAVDNDYRRSIDKINGNALTLQLYTQLTGSFNLDMGYIIALGSVAPGVVYNPYEVMNQPHTENSFHRLTFKDDEIQEHTTTPDFHDVDKDTYKPVQRVNLRFKITNDQSKTKIAETSSNPAVKNILDISSGGLAVEQNGTLKVGDKFTINITYKNITLNQQVKVVRTSGNVAGLKFIKIDRAASNKILYMNMLLSQENKINKISKSN